MKRWVALAAVTIGLPACIDSAGPATQLRPAAPQVVSAARATPIPGDYIVTLRGDVTDVESVAQALASLHKGALKHLYKTALKGFAVQHISESAAAAIARDPRVARVEVDQVMTALGSESPATWGIDRIDQGVLPLDNTYTYPNDGTGVTVYIIDTGINFSHVDFGGRASTGVDEVTTGGNAADCNGHGTHVSGTVAGSTYGVAKNATLVAVRVLNCQGSGTTSGVIAGIDWVTANRVLPAAANMSLGGGLSTTLNQAVARAVAAGVTFAVAAGNSTADACGSSPSSEPSAITVGATDINDSFASFSNYGSCVDLNAPGVNITSDWYSSNTATNTISGTSMATPHVTGAAALYLAANPTAAPSDVASALTTNATQARISGVPAGTPNLLLYTTFIGGGSPPPPPPPAALSASFTKSCSGLTCIFTNTSKGTTSSTTFAWNFGDGSAVVTTPDATHTFAARHSYTVKLTDTDATTSPANSTATQTVTCNRRNCS